MSQVVLDASALIALIAEEDGAKAVETVLSDACASVINLGEVAQWLIRAGGTADEARAVIDALEIEAVQVNWPQALMAASLRARARAKGLSQADCLCLALAMERNALVLTADRAWSAMADDVDVEIRLIR
jgi:PIN domain nuclease of toxin-antitoxin system